MVGVYGQLLTAFFKIKIVVPNLGGSIESLWGDFENWHGLASPTPMISESLWLDLKGWVNFQRWSEYAVESQKATV